MKAAIYTLMALIAFAANSLLCRMALAKDYIDPWNFTALRLLSGAFCLAIIMLVHKSRLQHHHLQQHSLQGKHLQSVSDVSITHKNAILRDTGSWISSLCLVVYALCFSLAYVELDTGTGALILFAAVQFTMIGWGIYQKEQLKSVQWIALAIAFAGFVYLMLPLAAVPSLSGALIMGLSGVAWGIYSVRGKRCVSPLRATGFNFIRSLVALPLLLIVGLSSLSNLTSTGVWLACISGAITSGVGYSLWYVALPLLKSTQAAVVQFCVPILAAIGGALVLSEALSLRFISASIIIIGAVLVFVLSKNTKVEPRSN